MDRGAWRATVHGDARVGHDLATEQQQGLLCSTGSSVQCFATIHMGKEADKERLYAQV